MSLFQDKTLLITGGTGSFGNAMVERMLSTDIGEIRIFSRDEKKQEDMRKKYPGDKLRFYIGDVRDMDSVADAMYGVDFIFHAAALKQVPSCEFFPLEAVKTNVLGTDHVLTAATTFGVKKIICLSTDKAAYPVNAMGTSKAMMEKVVIAKSRMVDTKKTVICCTRYGNVMGSRGSVIPLFIQQIKKNQPLTITDPAMTRFMMSLEEAVELVLFAFEYGQNGDIFVQKAAAASMGILSAAMKTIFNHKLDDIIIGIRHGEKIHETLLTVEESQSATDMGDFYRVTSDKRDLNYDKYLTQGISKNYLLEEFNSHNTRQMSLEEMIDKLMQSKYMKEQLELLEEKL